MNYKLVESDDGTGFTFVCKEGNFKFFYENENEFEIVDMTISKAIFSNWHQAVDVEPNDEILDWVRSLTVSVVDEDNGENQNQTDGKLNFIEDEHEKIGTIEFKHNPNAELDSYMDSELLSHFGKISISEKLKSPRTPQSTFTKTTSPQINITPTNLKPNLGVPSTQFITPDPSTQTPLQSGRTTEKNTPNSLPMGLGVIGDLEDLRGEQIDVKLNGNIYCCESNSNQMVPLKTNVTCLIVDVYPQSKQRFKKILYIASGDKLHLSTVINTEIYPKFETTEDMNTFIWTRDNYFYSFAYAKEDTLLKSTVQRAVWEAQNNLPFPLDNNPSIFEGLSNAQIYFEDKEESESDEDTDEEDSEEEENSEEESEEEEESSEESSEDSDNKTKNSLLSVGRKSDLSYVVKGNQIEVFKKMNQGLKRKTKIRNVTSTKRDPINPKVAMLHQEDSALLLVDNQSNQNISFMDLEKERVVADYDTLGMSVDSLLPETKFAQKTSGSSFLALNHAGFFAVDPRSKHPVVQSKAFQYSKTNPKALSCGATTQKGHIVVGTKKGEIRFYGSSIFKQVDHIPKATNAFPGLGEPIIAIDVTANGKWVLATCTKYLFVIKAGDDVNAFESTISKDKKPTPILLKLKNRDEEKVGQVSFTPAKFDYNGKEERICTSTGPWLISWNFKKVRKNNCNVYSMKKFSDVVVDDNFLGDSIVVTMPHEVKLTSLK